MIFKFKNLNDGRSIRVHLFTSTDENRSYELLGMLIMNSDEWLVFQTTLKVGAKETGLKVIIENDEITNDKKDGGIRIPK